MIELYYWSSPNVQKIVLFLEEAGLHFRVKPIDVTRGEQYSPEFTATFLNSRIPAIIDRAPEGGGDSIPVFESGAILLYLADKTGLFLSKDIRARTRTLQWLFWQVGGLGPIGGQRVHFRNYAPRPVEYALQRYDAENQRLIGVLDRLLAEQPFIAGSYSIADMACYPWIAAHDRRQQLDFAPFPHLARWFTTIGERPATQRAYAIIAEVLKGPYVSDVSGLSAEARRILFGAHAV